MILRRNADGSPDNTFGALTQGNRQTGVTVSANDNGSTKVADIALQGPNVVFVGSAQPSGQLEQSLMGRLTPDGALDGTFISGGLQLFVGTTNERAASVQIDTGGKIILGGTNDFSGNNSDFYVTRMGPNGGGLVSGLFEYFSFTPFNLVGTGAGIDRLNDVSVANVSDDDVAPTITALTLPRDAKGKKVIAIVLTFSETVTGTDNVANFAANYALVTLGKPGKPAKPVALASVTYDAVARTVRIVPRKAIKLKSLAKTQLAVNGSGTIADAAANMLDGDANGSEGGNFVRTLNQGVLASAVSVLDQLLESRRLSRAMLIEDEI